MSDLNLLRELTPEFRPPPYDDLVAVSRKRRRRSAMAAAAAAVAAVIVVTAVAAGVADRRGADPGPVDRAPATPRVNGQVQGIDDYLDRARPACDRCDASWIEFEQDTGTLLVIWSSSTTDDLGVGLIGPDSQLADISLVDPNSQDRGEPCTDDRPCGTGLASLGPGADEVSVQAHPYGSEVQVLGFDGTVRRTMDLTAAVDEEQVRGLAWSPDGSRLAVTTRRFVPTGGGTAVIVDLWMVDRDGGEPQLVYTASDAGPVPDGNAPFASIISVKWSPDGSRLGFIEEYGYTRPSGLVVTSTQATSLLLPGPGQAGLGEARTLYEYAKRCCAGGPVFLWSPDGTRVAVRVPGQVLELSAEDGSVLAEHPFIEGLLIWPARQ